MGIAYINSDLFNFFMENIKITIGNSRRLLFWVDTWMGDNSLSTQFPRLFQLSTEKEISLSAIL